MKLRMLILPLIFLLVIACASEQVQEEDKYPEANRVVAQDDAIATLLGETPTEVVKSPEEPTAPVEEQIVEVIDVPAPKIVNGAPSDEFVILTEKKLMEPTELTVKPGTTVVWENRNSNPHVLAVENEGKRLELSDRISPGDKFEYTFNDSGEFLVRDLFSGGMRIIITVE